MFTGIVEQIGEVRATERTDAGRRIVVSGASFGDLAVGASISVNGVCLTAIESNGDIVSLDVVPETLRRTNLGDATPGTKVNLERAMPADGRFEGHMVQGHVDGVGTIERLEHGDDGSVTMSVAAPDSILRYLVEKGSIAIDGVSLTVASVSDATFAVALIPHTLQVTTLGLRMTGDQVNLELDVVAKYVERLLR